MSGVETARRRVVQRRNGGAEMALPPKKQSFVEISHAKFSEYKKLGLGPHDVNIVAPADKHIFIFIYRQLH